MPRNGATLAAVLLVVAVPARGDEATIVADRPGFGESASAVARGRLQVETGAAFTWVGRDATAFDAPQALVRFGLPGSVEVRLGVPEWVDARDSGERTTGWTDVSVGLKGHLAAGANDLSLRATAYLPTGSLSLTSDRLDPELAVAWSRVLSGPWSLGATVSQRWLRRYAQAVTSPSVSLGLGLGGRAGTFVEYAATVGPDISPVQRIDHGYTWTPSSRTQLDVSFGVAFSRAPTTVFAGAGFSHRF